jgi:glycosyltransferase involved in cell wall biosynthesis
MDDGTPVITVVITTKNRMTLLLRAIDSVLNQTWRSLELIVVDDGSDLPVVLPHSDPRLRLIRNDTSRGLSEARNIGFRAASGEYLCMLDDDDWYLPHKLEQQLSFLRANPDVDLVFSRVIVRDALGRDRHYLGLDHVHSAAINLCAFNIIHPASVLFRKKVFDNVQFDPAVRKYEDTLFFNRVCFAFKTAYFPADVAVWMQDGRPDQLTRVLYERNFVNFQRVCSNLMDILEQNPLAKRRYYKRLAYQAVRCGRLTESIRAVGTAFSVISPPRLSAAQ